ncbi:MAG: efflux RND transporter periplasmic adaptor subunit [Pseudomonadales bacterium]|nr:efflux RND transporter periplasmic adaptor subunit [Pseudomonadales bacterium]
MATSKVFLSGVRASVLGAVGLVLGAALLSGCAAEDASEKPASNETAQQTEQLLPVRVSYLDEHKARLHQTFIGTARAANRVTIRSQISGRLLERDVKLGTKVDKGTVLARVYNPGATPLALAAKQRWQQAQVEVAQAERDHKRIQSLFEKGVASIQEAESARSALLAARAATDAAESNYQQALQLDDEQTIRAPFPGIVTATPVEPGEVIQVGQPLLQLADPKDVEIEVIVSDAAASTVKAGDVLNVVAPYSGDETFVGVVHEVTPFRERGALPTVVVRLQDTQLIPGTTVHIQFASTVAGQFALPVSSLIKTGDKQSAVYRLTANNQVELVPVTPLKVIQDQVVIDGDLALRDAVVIAGNHQLFPGAKVRVVQ